MPIVVDFIHVAQNVWEAALALFPDNPPEQDHWVRAHLLEILRGKESLVAAGIRRSATLREMATAERKPLDVCGDYLLSYALYLRQRQGARWGCPDPTAVVEGACRHLVEDRMNLMGRVGVYWVRRLCSVCALRASYDFDAYWEFHEQQEYQRNHASQYADHHVPEIAPSAFSPQPSRRGTLKIVKKKGES